MYLIRAEIDDFTNDPLARQLNAVAVPVFYELDAEGQSTYCDGCGEVLIARDWYRLGHYGLSPDGDCQQCGHRLAGRFAERPGSWGPRRLAVTV